MRAKTEDKNMDRQRNDVPGRERERERGRGNMVKWLSSAESKLMARFPIR